LKTKLELIEKNILEISKDFYKDCPSGLLKEAVFYALFSGGKRVRPLIGLLCAESSLRPNDRGSITSLIKPLIALEYVHTYSLIHDDLPCMDDDDERRGKPTVHKAFDEATAILAGDALLSDAFYLASCAINNSSLICRELSHAIGSHGMVAGQVLDVFDKPSSQSENLKQINFLKTAKLFEASCVIGGLVVNANNSQIKALREFGQLFGLLFQMRDDELDFEVDERKSENFQNKTNLAEQSKNILRQNNLNSQELFELIDFCSQRKK